MTIINAYNRGKEAERNKKTKANEARIPSELVGGNIETNRSLNDATLLS